MKLTTLGRLGVEGGRLRRQKPLLLLAYLAVEGVKPRRHLAELFFAQTSDPLNSLSRALSNLRKESEGLVEADNTRAWTTVGSDVVQFLGHADAGDLGECETLYGGAFAEDLNLELGAELEEWVLGTREYLAGRYRDILLRLGEVKLKEKNPEEAARYGEKAYNLTGASELEPEHLIRVYHLLTVGNSPKAPEVREEAESFGIDLPLPSLSSDQTQGTEHTLPLPKSSFVGRDPELLEIAEQLAHSECRLLTLHGTGGVGKSRLALQAAYEASETGQFKDGITFVPLDSLTSADLIPSSLAEALKLTLSGQDDTLTQVIRTLNDKHSLIILDNFEHLMDGTDLVDRLLNACPNLKLIVTSRERLRLEQEWVLTLTGLTLPEDETERLEQLQNYDALNLFTQRAKRTRLDFSLTNEDLPYALKICQLVDGYPLGIELSAVWVKLLPLQDIATEIEKNVDILTHGTRNALERHQSIRAVFEHSWKLLTTQEQDVLMKLSVFVGGFRREAAAEVADATLPILASLVDKSLLRVMPNGRYDRHPLLYQLVWEKLNQDEALKISTQNLYINYFARFLENQSKVFCKVQSKEVLHGIDDELTNVMNSAQTAFNMKQSRTFVNIMRLLADDCAYFEARGCSDSTLNLLGRAASLARDLKDLRAAQRLYTELGDVWRSRYGRYLEARDAYETAWEIAECLGDSHNEVILLSLIGMTSFLQDELGFEQYLDKAEKLATQNNDALALSHVLQNRSHIAYENQSWEEMENLCKRSLELLNEIAKEQDKVPESSTIEEIKFYSLLNLGEAQKKLHKFPESLDSRNRALALAEEAGNQIWQAYTMQELGEYYHECRNRQLAQYYFTSALCIYKAHAISSDTLQLERFVISNEYFIGF